MALAFLGVLLSFANCSCLDRQDVGWRNRLLRVEIESLLGVAVIQ